MSNGNAEGSTLVQASYIANIVLAILAIWQLAATNEANRRAEAAGRQAQETANSMLELERSNARYQAEIDQLKNELEHSPVLTVKQCCNQVPVTIKTTRSDDRFSKIALRTLTKIDPILVNRNDDIRARTAQAFVVEIANVGKGAALGTKANWQIDKVTLTNGSAVTVSDEFVNGHMRPYTWPAVIEPNEHALVRHLPRFIEIDDELQIANVTGSLIIQCQNASGKNLEFRQSFTLDTVYHPEPPVDELNGTRLSFHFFELENKPKHVMGKPVVNDPFGNSMYK